MQVSDVFKFIAKRVVKLKKKLKTSDKQNEIHIFILLYSMVAIQLFDDNEDIESVIKVCLNSKMSK